MRTLRKCDTAHFNTGTSKCPPDFAMMRGAILVAKGAKLPADLTGEKLEKLAHGAVHERIYGIFPFREYAKNGGEAQTSATGYGPEEFTGISARKDTFTLDRFYPELHAAITRTAHRARGVYFFDENNVLYGIDDGTDILAPFPMSSVYSDATPHRTSSGMASMTVTCAFEDPKEAIVSFDYTQLSFDPSKLTLGLVDVELKKVGTTGNAYKLYEKVGGLDVTPQFGPLIVSAGNTVLSGSTSATTYDEGTETLTIASTAGADVRLKSPAVLYENDIKGIEQA